MHLEIEFLDGPPQMEVGSTTRVRVVHEFLAPEDRKAVALERVKFEFKPLEWGRITATDDPAVGTLEVIEIIESTDPLLSPSYSIQAFLSAQGRAQLFKPERMIRIIPTAIEIELVFEVGREHRWTRFGPSDLSEPIDWEEAAVGDPETQTLFLREDRPFLRIEPFDGFPFQVEITFPNGETASLQIDGEFAASQAKAPLMSTGARSRLNSDQEDRDLSSVQPALAEDEEEDEDEAEPSASEEDSAPEAEPEAGAETVLAPSGEEQAEAGPEAAAEQAVAEEEAQVAAAQEAARAAAAETQRAAEVEQAAEAARLAAEAEAAEQAPSGEELRESLTRLLRYANSFSGAQRSRLPREKAISIRARIEREHTRVRAEIEGYRGADRAELLGILTSITKGLADWATPAVS
ncbi:MAG: hypothetical protein JKY65_22700 [Planctomycetes bacterium]|nr:hypothetical protein [Planctomycetota bacterium]